MSDQLSESEKIHGKLYQLSGKFIDRTRTELVMMHKQLDAACEGDVVATEQLLLLAHRINGSAAMFGFGGVSEPARGIERMLRDGPLTPQQWRAIERYLQQLQVAVSEVEENLVV